jgi:hypothetical protein
MQYAAAEDYVRNEAQSFATMAFLQNSAKVKIRPLPRDPAFAELREKWGPRKWRRRDSSS